LVVDELVDVEDDGVTDKDGGKHTGDEMGDSKTRNDIKIWRWTKFHLID